jgi:hypothetical protein
VVGNPDESRDATVQLYFTPEGTRDEELREEVVLAPGDTRVWSVDEEAISSETSLLRTGGIYRVSSNVPVVAYHYAVDDPRPFRNNDSSLLLPEETFKTDFVVASYWPSRRGANDGEDNGPSYFSVIALEDDTEVQWTPPVDTFGNGLPVPSVAAGETGSVLLNRLDNVRVAAYRSGDHALRDLSGTVIHSSKPVAVFGAVRCSTVPVGAWTCDHMHEQLFPLAYWGEQYVIPRPPPRDPNPAIEPRNYYRIYAATDDVTITTVPPLPQAPINLAARGSFVDVVVDAGISVVFTGDKPFMPVQYLASGWTDENNEFLPTSRVEMSDPAMTQNMPVEQWLSRYVFVTGQDWEEEYAQVVRIAGAADVIIDGTAVTGWTTLGTFEFADVLLDNTNPHASHIAESDDGFSLIQFGYNGRAIDIDVGGNGPACTTDADCMQLSTSQTCTGGFCSKSGIACTGEPDCDVPISTGCDLDKMTCANIYDDMNASYAHPVGIRAEEIFLP